MDLNLQIILLIAGLLTVGLTSDTPEYADYWTTAGEIQLEEILRRRQEKKHAKNVIIFIGDGMGLSTITSARIYKGQKMGEMGERDSLGFEKFPNIGLSKTYDVDKQVTDSAAAATALFTGVKTNFGVLGMDAHAQMNVCSMSSNVISKVSSIMTWAQTAGKDTGFVTTTRVTHATPAALYAHINNRNWECDSAIPDAYKNCAEDIASQLVKNEPGRNFKVILGGGANELGLNGIKGKTYYGDCRRGDGNNLVQEWQRSKNNSLVVTSRQELLNANLVKTDYLLGLFGPDHLSFTGEYNANQPSLAEMTTHAIRILLKNPNGFVLMVEGGLIDIAHHSNYARLALEETLEFEKAISTAATMMDEYHTLIVVTADHSHSLTMNGYPVRGSDILGVTEYENKTYETLTYANGPGYIYHKVNNSVDPNKIWRDLKNSTVDRNGIYYQHFSPLYLSNETHAGEDVAVYANGPSSHLFTGVYEQSYIAHAISYIACIGPHADKCNTLESASTRLWSYKANILTFISILVYCF